MTHNGSKRAASPVQRPITAYGTTRSQTKSTLLREVEVPYPLVIVKCGCLVATCRRITSRAS